MDPAFLRGDLVIPTANAAFLMANAMFLTGDAAGLRAGYHHLADGVRAAARPLRGLGKQGDGPGEGRSRVRSCRGRFLLPKDLRVADHPRQILKVKKL